MAQSILATGSTAIITGTYVDAADGATKTTTLFPATPSWSVASPSFTLNVSADGLQVTVTPADATVSASTVLTVTSGTLTASVDITFAPTVVVPPVQDKTATAIGIQFI